MRRLFFIPVLATFLTACGEKQAETSVAPTLPPAVNTQAAVSNLSGKDLHDTNCISCHDTAKYTSPEHKMQSYAMLSNQVRNCDANLGTKLFDEDITKIVDYLNDAFYKFPK